MRGREREKMTNRKFGKAIAAIFFTSLLVTSSSFPEASGAQEPNSIREGLPGRRIGSGTRGECNFGQKQLTALIPKNNLALTVAANPQLFFYLPSISNSQTIEFVLLDEADNQIYEKTFKPTSTNGIISLSLSDASLKELAISKKYHWYLSIICNAQDRANDISVDGWIQRVELNPTLAKKLEQTAPLQRPTVYATADLWQDALANLAQLRLSHPNDTKIASEWSQLLRSIDLNNIAQEPVVALSF